MLTMRGLWIGEMEDRASAGIYLEMTNAAPEAYAAQRLGDVRALPGVGVTTLWRNQKPGRDDFPRTIPEFETLAVYEVNTDFEAPACPGEVWGHHYERVSRPTQGILGAGPTLGLEIVLVSPSTPELRQALRNWADRLHIREIAATVVPGMAMITPYEKKGEGDPGFLHLYEIDEANAETAFERMAPLTIARIRERGGKRAVVAWMDNEGLRIDYTNSFTRVMDAG
jgi:hypothetical protein